MSKILDPSLKQNYYSNGKLLLTGEYLVLDGATALAIPTRFGQSLNIDVIDRPKIIWQSLDLNGKIWFESEFNIKDGDLPFESNNKTDNAIRTRLQLILLTTKQLNTNLLKDNIGYYIKTKLDFPINWGLGSSSTLINNLAKWAKVDPYKILEASFGGSGYDIAAAQHNLPILYSLLNNSPLVKEITLPWNFTDHLFFVHLNQKQSSKDGIEQYKSKKNKSALAVSEISDITTKISSCKSLQEFEELMIIHEKIISEIIEQKPVKELLFKDYKGTIKSMGAWGGDFILVSGGLKDWNYFRKKGYQSILSFEEMKL